MLAMIRSGTAEICDRWALLGVIAIGLSFFSMSFGASGIESSSGRFFLLEVIDSIGAGHSWKFYSISWELAARQH